MVPVYPNAAHKEMKGRCDRNRFLGDIQSDIVFAELINLLQPFMNQFLPKKGNIEIYLGRAIIDASGNNQWW